MYLNTNKKGVTLDITSPTGQGLFKRLVETSDILIENLNPGEMASFGLGYESLKELNPRLVMTSITPFGQTGPYQDYQFTELTLFAMTGAMFREGIPEREPLKYGGEITQYFAGCTGAAVTMSATFKALLTGQGEWIDLSIMECMAGHPHQIAFRMPFAYSGERDTRKEPRASRLLGLPRGTFRCKDGHVTLFPLGFRMWPYVARIIGRPELVEDPRFKTPEELMKHQVEFDAIFQPWLDARTREEIFEAAQNAGIPSAPILTAPKVLANSHFRERNFFLEIEHPDAGTLTYPGLPFQLTGTPHAEARPAPRLGEHNEEILCDVLGLQREELANLRDMGTV